MMRRLHYLATLWGAGSPVLALLTWAFLGAFAENPVPAFERINCSVWRPIHY
jgi:hypothetical protein